jgi:tetratricopeptide (TPR) repeat protein/tRNA A-37 threonylcarbamoyl transferase component Bud32
MTGEAAMTTSDTSDWSELSALFDECSELPAPERSARIAAVRADNPGLAVRLEAMLAADTDGEGPLERSLDDLAPTLHDSLLGADWETRAGQLMGRYRLIAPIGSGGMGEVWRAERADGEYRQDVALKLLKRGIDTQAILRRFLQERAILARLVHPNIVRLLDGGMSDDGRPYYVMEHVAGATVTRHAQMAALGVRERVELVIAIAQAVSYAHAQLVVHRDLKPSNILIDADGAPHLLDFGIAKLLEDSGEQTMTGTGMRVMSPAYAAPEQILGEAVGTATDVYALGAILFELLTGELPHRRTSRDPSVLAVDLTTDSERPSCALARSSGAVPTYGDIDRKRVRRQVAGDLDLIVDKALRRDPLRRYPTMAAFADDLRRWLDGRAIVARPDNVRYRLGRFVARNRIAVGAAALVLAALIGGLGAALWQARIARHAAHIASIAEEKARQQAAIATAVSDFLTRDLIQAANPYGGKLAIPLTEALIQAGERIDRRFEGSARLAGVVHRELAESLRLAGAYDSAATHAERAMTALRGVVTDDDPELQKARLTLARVLQKLDRFPEARIHYEQGLKALEASPDPMAALPFQVQLAGLDVEELRIDEALVALERLEPAVRAGLGDFSDLHVDLLDHRTRAFMHNDRFADAGEVNRQLRAGTEQRHGVGHPLTLRFLMREAVVLTAEERFQDALPRIEAACTASRTALGAEHDATHECLMRQGVILYELGRYDDASALFEPVAAYRERTYGVDANGTWLGWVWLARGRQHQGRLDEARALFERADGSAARVLGPGHANALPFRQGLGMFLHETGQLAQAYDLRMDLMARCQRTLPEGHVNIAKYAWDAAQTMAAMERDDEYIAFSAIWLPHWERLFGDTENRVVNARAWLDAAQRRQRGRGIAATVPRSSE